MVEKFVQITENKEDLNIKIEIAKEKDWENCKKIWQEAMDKEPQAYWVTKESKEREQQKTEEEWRNELNNPNSIIMLTKNNEIAVGTNQALLKAGTSDQWGLRRIYLNKDFRGKGLGEKMFHSILEEIKKRGGKKARLNVVDTQKAAKELYEKNGFKVYEKFDSRIMDGIEYPSGQWMEKEI